MLLTVTSRKVLLPDFDLPRPATINVDLNTGKIIGVFLGYIGDEACKESRDSCFVDAGDKVVLPGLVEGTRKPGLGRILDRHASRSCWRYHHSN